jgi:hypothetical protein
VLGPGGGSDISSSSTIRRHSSRPDAAASLIRFRFYLESAKFGLDNVRPQDTLRFETSFTNARENPWVQVVSMGSRLAISGRSGSCGPGDCTPQTDRHPRHKRPKSSSAGDFVAFVACVARLTASQRAAPYDAPLRNSIHTVGGRPPVVAPTIRLAFLLAASAASAASIS